MHDTCRNLVACKWSMNQVKLNTYFCFSVILAPWKWHKTQHYGSFQCLRLNNGAEICMSASVRENNGPIRHVIEPACFLTLVNEIVLSCTLYYKRYDIILLESL